MNEPVLVENRTLADIADSLRVINNGSLTYLPGEMADAVLAGEKSVLERVAVTASATGSPASLSDGADHIPVKALTAAVEPAQAGGGDPSPDNVRPISGRTGATVKRYGTDETDRLVTLSLPFPAGAGTVYGGTLDVTAGVLTVDRGAISGATYVNHNMGNVTRYESAFNETNGFMGIRMHTNGLAALGFVVNGDRPALCSHFKWVKSNWSNLNAVPSIGYVDGLHIAAHYTALGLDRWVSEGFSDTQKESIARALESMIIVWYYAEPLTYQLTPREVRTLQGENHVSADTGAVSVTYRVKAAGGTA